MPQSPAALLGKITAKTVGATGILGEIPAAKHKCQENIYTSDWMTRCSGLLGHVPLNEILMPGTHDSATYSMRSSASYAADFESEQRKVIELFKSKGALGFLENVAPVAAAPWSVTQNHTIFEQLCEGARYLDIRICFDNRTNSYVTCHGLVGISLEDALIQIYKFSSLYPREVIIVDINHAYNMDERDHRNVCSMIKRRFGARLAPLDQLTPRTPLAEFQRLQQSIVAIYCVTQYAEEYGLWTDRTIRSSWKNRRSVDEILKLVQEDLLERDTKEMKLFVSQCILTPNADFIIDAYKKKHNVKSTMELSELLTPKVGAHIRQEWLKLHGNIFIVDNFCEHAFTNLLIFGNIQKHAIAAKGSWRGGRIALTASTEGGMYLSATTNANADAKRGSSSSSSSSTLVLENRMVEWAMLPAGQGTFALLSSTGKFLSSGHDGRVSCQAENIERDERWNVTVMEERSDALMVRIVAYQYGRALSLENGNIETVADADPSVVCQIVFPGAVQQDACESDWVIMHGDGGALRVGEGGVDDDDASKADPFDYQVESLIDTQGNLCLHSCAEVPIVLKSYHGKYMACDGDRFYQSDKLTAACRLRLKGEDERLWSLTNANGKIVCFHPEGHLETRDNVGAWEQFRFTEVPGPCGCYTIYSAEHRHFLCANSDGSVICNRERAEEWENWSIIKWDESMETAMAMTRENEVGSFHLGLRFEGEMPVLFRGYHGKYLASDGDRFYQTANASDPCCLLRVAGYNESWTLRNAKGNYFCFHPEGHLEIRESVGAWEQFQLREVAGGYTVYIPEHKRYVCAERNGSLVCDRKAAEEWETWKILRMQG